MRESKNIFNIYNDYISITRPEWDFVAYASVRPDFLDEIKSVSWSLRDGYLYNNRLNYLHIYIMKKYYPEEYEQMRQNGCTVDHMDNNGFNCRIENLSFLLKARNTAKGLTLDKELAGKTYIALSMFKDFTTSLYQISIEYNNPAKLMLKSSNKPSIVISVRLLYDTKYEYVLLDAFRIMDEYTDEVTFSPENLNMVDWEIYGSVGHSLSFEEYDSWRENLMKSGKGFMQIQKRSYDKGWIPEQQRKICMIRPI